MKRDDISNLLASSTHWTRRSFSLAALAACGTALASYESCGRAQTPALPILRSGDPGPRQARDGYYVDIRRMIGGDGDISRTLELARRQGLGAWIAAGNYTHSGELDIAGMRIEAASGATIAARGAGKAMFRAGGELTPLPSIARDPQAGWTSIAFAAPPQLAANDWLVLFDPTNGSFNPARFYYRAGEWCRVSRVNGSIVELADPLKAGYLAARLRAFRAATTTADLVGGAWDAGGKHLTYLTLCHGGVVAPDRVRARANTVVMIDRCVDTVVQIGDGSNEGVGSDDYLVCIANCRGVRVRGGTLGSRRHPVAIGGGDVPGAVPNRDCIVDGCVLTNEPATVVACADLHGNCEDCGYVGAQITGGVSLGGANPIYRNCTIVARADGNLAESTEFLGGHVDFTGSQFSSSAVNVGGGRGLIDLGTQNGSLNAATTRDVLVDLTRFRLSAPRLAANEAIVRASNQGSNARFDVIIQDGAFELSQPVQLVRAGGRAGAGRNGEIVLQRVTGIPRQSRSYVREGGALDALTLRSAL